MHVVTSQKILENVRTSAKTLQELCGRCRAVLGESTNGNFLAVGLEEKYSRSCLCAVRRSSDHNQRPCKGADQFAAHDATQSRRGVGSIGQIDVVLRSS